MGAVYAVQAIAVPYLSGIYRSWTETAREREQEQERRRLEDAEGLRRIHEQLLAVGQSVAEAARSLRDQAARCAWGSMDPASLVCGEAERALSTVILA